MSEEEKKGGTLSLPEPSEKKPGGSLARRDLLKYSAAGLAGLVTLGKIDDLLAESYPTIGGSYHPDEHWWGFVVDLRKCIGCGACVRACKEENSVPDGFFRTWVERYTFLKDGRVLVDSPDGALEGFEPRADVKPEEVTKSFFVPKLCNHCEQSPCVQVCPVGASYQSPDGLVLIDKTHCIGCGYCVQACPYGCRYLNPVTGTADKCTMCYHRISKGLKTACVEACPHGARHYGDLKDPNSEVRRLLNTSRYGVLKPDLGTHPKCFYIGLDEEVV